MSDPQIVLSASDLDLVYDGKGGAKVRAVQGVNLKLRQGETLALVGESGCGKSSLSRALMRLEAPTAGRVQIRGEDVTTLSGEALRQKRRQIQMIFQDPYTSLNPRMSVRQIVREPLDNYRMWASGERDGRVLGLLERVGLASEFAQRFPHELSGGQRQRVGIARALALEPSVLVADEPVSALDVSIQAQVINLLADIQAEQDLSILFISHDLGVVAHISDRIAVMYLGRIVEIGDSDKIVNDPQHPYTRALLDAVPVLHPRMKRARSLLSGDMPSPSNPPPGCAFHPRCRHATARCQIDLPKLRAVSSDRQIACHLDDMQNTQPLPESTF